MSTSTTQELQELGEQFHKWRQNKIHRYVPQDLWDKAFLLVEKYSVKEVAGKIGFPAAYVRRKLKKKPDSSEPTQKFVEIHAHQGSPLEAVRDMKLRLQQPEGTVAELFFQGDVEQVFPLMRLLLRGESPCSK